MDLMELLRRMARSYPVIVTGALLCTVVFCSIFAPSAPFGVEMFRQLLFIGVVGVLPHAVFYSKKEISKRGMLLRYALHMLLLLSLLLICAIRWEWVDANSLPQIGLFVLLVLAVYAVVLLTVMRKDQKTADRLNERLQEFHKGE